MPVRLNIGCKNIYKPGYINIDDKNDIIADLITEPFNLPYEDNSIDIIESYNFIEELSLEKAYVSFEEWFRILKPDGILIIESVNIDHILTAYGKADDFSTKEIILKQIFESEIESYKHLSGHFFWRLSTMLQNIGFDSVKEELPKLKLYNDCFRLVCSKPDVFQNSMVVHRTKKRAITELDDLNCHNSRIFWEFNTLIGDISISNAVNRIDELPLNASEDFFNVVSYSPKVAKILIEECANLKLISNELFNIYKAILTRLIASNYIPACYKSYLDSTKEPKTFMDNYNSLLQNNNTLIARLFKAPPDQVSSLITDFTKKILSDQKGPEFDLSKEIFSFEHIKDSSRHLQLKGIKAFSQKDMKLAYSYFHTAIKLNPELYYSYANLGLLEAISKNYGKAIDYFTECEKISDSNKILLYLGMTLLYMQQYSLAASTVVNLQEDSFEKFTIMGNCYFHLHNFEEANEAFSWALISNPIPVSYVNLGLTLEKLDNHKEAESQFNMARKIVPNIPIPGVPYLPVFKQIPISLGELE